MYYPDEVVDEVRTKSDIVDVVSGYVKLQKKGSNYWACCPFHNERTPSFSVNAGKQMFHCFGCSASGNVFTFIMKYENYTFPEAVRLLAERAGVELPEASAEQREKANRRARLLEANKEAAKFFYYQLRQPRGAVGYQYLKKRELSDETMHRFGLGYAGKNGADLVQYLRRKGFEDELIKEAGLANYSERHGLSSQFWNRVMFPIQDINHRVIGFGGRVMGDGEPKYLNSPETPVFDKRRNLYGLNYARSASARSGNIIICEGYMDVISMHQAGFTQAVASLGTAFTPEQANLLRKYTGLVLLAYDSDGAGVKAALRGIGILREAGLTGRVINMRPYKDPDEFMKALGREAFQERIDQAESSFFFEIRILAEQCDMKDPEAKTKFHHEIAKKLCEFSDEVERDNYLPEVAAKYFIDADKLRKLVVSYAAQTGLVKPVERPKSGVRQKFSPEEAEKKKQRFLLTWLADEPSLWGKVKEYISEKDFTDPLYRKAAERFFAELDAGKCDPAGIVSAFEEGEEQNQVSQLFQTELRKGDTPQEREKAFRDILVGVKENSFRYYTGKVENGEDVMEAWQQTVDGKRALEQLKNAHISLE